MARDFPPENLAEATAAELVPAVADISSRDKEIPGDKLSGVWTGGRLPLSSWRKGRNSAEVSWSSRIHVQHFRPPSHPTAEEDG